MQNFHCGFPEAKQMNMKVNWLQAAECFIRCLLELHLSQSKPILMEKRYWMSLTSKKLDIQLSTR